MDLDYWCWWLSEFIPRASGAVIGAVAAYAAYSYLIHERKNRQDRARSSAIARIGAKRRENPPGRAPAGSEKPCGQLRHRMSVAPFCADWLCAWCGKRWGDHK